MKTRGPIWKVSIRTTSEAEDAVTELLQEFFGTPASSYTNVETREVTVAVYLTKRPELSAVRIRLKRIKECGLNIGPGKISVQRVRREDWAESWKRHFKPIEIGSALLIKPSWSKQRPKKNQAVVVLDPGLSFGTGQHPTTAFCLRQLVSSLEFLVSSSSEARALAAINSKLKTRNPKFSFLDIGTGSGILAIAAAKLGYTPVKAFDFDPESVRIAQENARSNGVSRKVNIRREDVTKLPARLREKFDLICANLISTLLISERQRIFARLKPTGVLVLAGILKDEFASVQTAYGALGMRLIASRIEKEWQSGAFTYQ